MNLTTPIQGVKFNHDSQILAIWASDKRNQLRMVHLPSGTVFANWPREDIPLKRIWTVEFSTTSAHVVIGNVQGHALLFKLHHFYGKS
jgi:U3 small nucleolar RNA-associated protein 18